MPRAMNLVSILYCFHIPCDWRYKYHLSPYRSQKAAACLLPNTCLGIGVQIIAKLEELQVGVQWDSISKPPTIDENFSLSLVMIMMLVQAAVCWILTWLDKHNIFFCFHIIEIHLLI